MAWRIDEQVIRGEIDNRERGRVTGRLWLAGRDKAVELDLAGNPWRDLAGHVLRFSNPEPKPGDLASFAPDQGGVVGDITASRKVKVPECSMEELHDLCKQGIPFPWHWGNSLYLEWFSRRNGRVVIEATAYELDISASAAWEMSEDEETEQRLANANALTDFMDRLATAAGGEVTLTDGEADDDLPQSKAEAEADEEAARMNLLLDRVTARLEREGDGEGQFERILREERERMRRERGKLKEEGPTPEEKEERARWIEEINAASEDALAEMESERWKGEDAERPPDHPLVKRCSDLSVQIHCDVEEGGWLPEDAQREHPLIEVVSSVMAASAKLAGALGIEADEDLWPPPALYAGDTLVRLKKARDYLRDVVRGLDSADDESLASASWRTAVRREIGEILGEVQELIHEVRQIRADGEE